MKNSMGKRKLSKHLLAVLLMIMWISMLCSGRLLAQTLTVGSTDTGADYTDLQSAVTAIEHGNVIELLEDYVLSDTLIIPEGKSLTITSSDTTFSLSAAEGFSSSTLIESRSSALSLENIVLNGSDKFQGVNVIGGTLTLQAATIQNCTADNGGGIYIEFGTLVMKDASSIENCSVSRSGGGLYAKSTTVTIASGSSIIGNDGDGIRSEGSFITIIDAVVSDNTATSGAGIYAGERQCGLGIRSLPIMI